MTRHSTASMTGLVRRYRRHVRGSAWALATLGLIVSLVALALPVTFTQTSAREVRAALADGPPSNRYLVAYSEVVPRVGPGGSLEPSYDDAGEELFGGFRDRLASVRDEFPPLAREATDPAWWTLTYASFQLSDQHPRTVPPFAVIVMTIRVDPRAPEQVELVEGTWPSEGKAGASPPTNRKPLRIALSEQQAAALGWKVGETRNAHQLSGIFRPIDADDDYWSVNGGMLEPSYTPAGNGPAIYYVTAFADPRTLAPDLLYTTSEQVNQVVWWPLDLSRMADSDVEDTVAELRQVASRPWLRSPDVHLNIGLGASRDLDGARERFDSARSTLTLVGVGPIGAALAVLVLGALVFGLRQQATVRHLLSRGVSRRAVRLARFVEALWICVPPVALAVGGRWLLAGQPPRIALVAAVVIALLPPVVLAASPLPPPIPTRSAGLAPRHRRYRGLLEVTVHALAALSIGGLLLSGARRSGTGVDVLAVAAPMLGVLSAFLVVLRLHPLPVGLLARRLQRGTSTVAWLGSLRALRDRTATMVPVFAALVGIAVSTLSVVLLATLASGTDQAALQRNGATLNVTVKTADGETLERIRGTDGVRAAAPLDDSRRAVVTVPGGEEMSVLLVLTDRAALSEVQSGVPGGLTGSGPGVVVSTGLAEVGDEIGLSDRYSGDEVSVEVVDTAGVVPGALTGSSWVLLDAATEGAGRFAPRTVLVALEPGADPRAVADAITETLGGPTRVTVSGDVADAVAGAPVNRYLRTVLLAAVLVVAAATFCAVVLALSLGARARARQSAILHVLGMPARRRTALALWEQTLPALLALLLGVVVGLGLAVLVQRTAGLTDFTGGVDDPSLTVPYGWLATLFAAFALVMATSVAVGNRVTSGRAGARIVKLDEE